MFVKNPYDSYEGVGIKKLHRLKQNNKKNNCDKESPPYVQINA